MKKHEITDSGLEKMFGKIIEQNPLLNDEQVNLLLTNPTGKVAEEPKKNYLRYFYKIIIPAATVILILITALFWLKPEVNQVENDIQNNLLSSQKTVILNDSVQLESVDSKEKIQEKLNESEIKLKEEVQKKPAISITEVFKHFEKKPQVFLIKSEILKHLFFTCLELPEITNQNRNADINF